MNHFGAYVGIIYLKFIDASLDFQDQVLTFIAKPRAAARGNGIFLFQVRPADLRAPRARLKEVSLFFYLKSGNA